MKFKMRGKIYIIRRMDRFVSAILIFIGMIGMGVFGVSALMAEDGNESQIVVIEKPVEKIVEKTVEIKVPVFPEDDLVNVRGIFPWYDNLEKNCKKYGLDPRLMMSIFAVESEFNPRCVNPRSGCRGLGQISYGTYRDINRRLKDGITWEQMKEPWANIKYSCIAMRDKLRERKTLVKAIHSYGGCISARNKTIYKGKVEYVMRRIYGVGINDVKIDTEV